MVDVVEPHREAVIGNIKSSFWLYDSYEGCDLTHPETPESPTVHNAIKMRTTDMPITIDPVKSTLVIIDMQNFSLSTALGRSADLKGLGVQKKILRYAIPAARQAGMRVIWLNWELTDQDLDKMPLQVIRCFGFDSCKAAIFDDRLRDSKTQSKPNDPLEQAEGAELQSLSNMKAIYRGLGNDMGCVMLEDGSEIEAGRMLMRDQWNTQPTPELTRDYLEGIKLHRLIPGFTRTACRVFGAPQLTAQDFSIGMASELFSSPADMIMSCTCVLLSDGAAISSPEGCQEAYESNAASTYGFCSSCEDLWNGVRLSTEKHDIGIQLPRRSGY